MVCYKTLGITYIIHTSLGISVHDCSLASKVSPQCVNNVTFVHNSVILSKPSILSLGHIKKREK